MTEEIDMTITNIRMAFRQKTYEGEYEVIGTWSEDELTLNKSLRATISDATTGEKRSIRLEARYGDTVEQPLADLDSERSIELLRPDTESTEVRVWKARCGVAFRYFSTLVGKLIMNYDFPPNLIKMSISTR